LMQTVGITAELALVLLLLALATIWLGERRSWHGPRWPAALMVDAVLLRLILSTAHQNHAATGRLLVGLVLCIALVLLTLAALAHRTLARREHLTAFHAVQTVASLSIGIVAVVYTSRAHGWDTAIAGSVALAISAATLWVALSETLSPKLTRNDYLFYLAVSAGLLFAGVALTAGELRYLLWALLGVGAAALGQRMHRLSLSIYGAMLIWGGAASSGLLSAAADAFVGGAQHWSTPSAGGLLVLALALASYWITATTQGQSTTRATIARIPAASILLLCAIGLAALLVDGERTVLGSHENDQAFLATARTVALTVVATVAALIQRRLGWAELVWLAYLMLALGGLKLVVEDLPTGRALTLLVAFAAYGIALITTQKLLRPLREMSYQTGGSLTETRRP
jgi:hypothetical protein